MREVAERHASHLVAGTPLEIEFEGCHTCMAPCKEPSLRDHEHCRKQHGAHEMYRCRCLDHLGPDLQNHTPAPWKDQHHIYELKWETSKRQHLQVSRPDNVFCAAFLHLESNDHQSDVHYGVLGISYLSKEWETWV